MTYAQAVADYIGTVLETTVYAGLVPEPRDGIVIAVTETGGGPADTRRGGMRYDDPGYILHIIGDDLTAIDDLAELVRRRCDRTAHIVTAHGTIETFAVGPPTRRMGMRSPRYRITLPVSAEMERSRHPA